MIMIAATLVAGCSAASSAAEHHATGALAASSAHTGSSTTPFAFATTLGDDMVLQASPAQSIVWGPLGDQATNVSVSWHATGNALVSKSHPVEVLDGTVKAKTQHWLGLKIWIAKLPAIVASFTTYTITAKPDIGLSASIANVTFGEVWLCSGQSNMGYTVAIDTHCFNKTRNTDGTPNCSQEVYGTCGGRACVWNAGKEVKDMRNYPHIRLMDVQQPPSPNYRPFFSPVPQANSLGWHRPDQYAGECRGNHNDCRPDIWGVKHCGCTNYSSATGCCSRDASGIWRQDEQTFSAACWFFARDLYASLDPPRPVGVMNNAVGGTAVQLWSPPDALASCKKTKEGQPPWGWPANYSSSYLWNALVVPLSRHVIRGVVWYQGEANTAKSPIGSTQNFWCHQCLIGALNCSAATKALCETPQNPVADGRTYLCSFPAMIEAWRALWYRNTDGATDSKFPFGWVQLNSNGQPDGPLAHPQALPSPVQNSSEDLFGTWRPGFPSLRWAQTQSLSKVERGFMAVVLDTPSPSGAIHSCHKQPVGSRLARGALATTYGRTDLKASAALSRAAAAANGKILTVWVANATGLIVRNRLGFEVLAGESNDTTTWQWHSAPILSTDGVQTLVLSLTDALSQGAAPHIVAVRYLWGTSPCSLQVFNCSIYVPVPKLGSLTGENDTLPLGPAILTVGRSVV